ncbi:para-nitrobenzyl esterase [Vibrio sp. 10N.286.49.B3]|uniref:carboxylesterase family protein n=1 Tax=Vibrio sp. 10N.286.49.B3 TaxID=1880855 RepID=UPI000C831E2B|nr:carboxylesterase family protein [Vibrio sp. 10N.286.49.B3]PMH43118.1 para-nitrobenzyl esterase [Vibrio sp. 10N.286.49.B3]
MTVFNRSTLAVTLSLALAACGSDDNTSRPSTPDPLQPLDPKEVSLSIGETTINALEESVVITTLDGDEERVSIEAFKGIPYAQAARFEHSQIINNLNDEAMIGGGLDATVFQDACPQLKATTQAQSEACLNLNIWRPAGLEGNEELPVYVFIHGGDFEYGAGSEPLIHADTVVAQGASDNQPFIAVTFNYRLGLLGSMWVDGKANPEGGNFGLGDQKRALEWVHTNIANFGGDASNVTLMGQGSGAMSVGILQQDDNKEVVTGDYFQRAIMQSNPYGFEYQSYDVAKNLTSDLDIDALKTAPLDDLMVKQKDLTEPGERIVDWLLKSLSSLSSLIPVSADNTPMATMMPFAPYNEYKKPLFSSAYGYHFISQPSQAEFTVPTVLGSNNSESNSFGMLPSLTFLIPTVIEIITELAPEVIDPEDADKTIENLAAWLNSKDNQQQLEQALTQPSINGLSEIIACLTLDSTEEIVACIGEQVTLPDTAYEAVVKLFFGLGNSEINNQLLTLEDYAPKEGLLGSIENMGNFKTLLNDMLFAGPARLIAAETSDNNNIDENGTPITATFYHFDYNPSFNFLDEELASDMDIIEFIKTIGCISGACHGSELPFVFNKSLRRDSTEVHPSTKDKALMNEMSRFWFSEALFSPQYIYRTEYDNVLLINEDGDINPVNNWDNDYQETQDETVNSGRLNWLDENQLTLGYF